MGTTGFIAQAWGAGNGNEIRAIVARAAVLALLLGAVLIALQTPIINAALWVLEGSDDLKSHTRHYFDIRIWSAPATLANYAILGCLIGMQNTRAVLLVQLCLNLSNVLLDLVFVVGFGMDVDGVATATLISEYIAAIVGAFIVYRQLTGIHGRFNGIAMFNRHDVRAMLTVNANIFIRTLCLILAFFLFTAKGTQLGEPILAANAVLMHFLQLIAYGLDGFAHAAEALVGGAIGSRNRHVFKQAVRVTTIWAFAVALTCSLIYFFFGVFLIGMITDIPSVQETAHVYLPWLIIAPLLSVWSYQLDGIFIGATRTTEMRNAMLFSLLFFVVTSWFLTDYYANHGLWVSLLLFNLVRAASLAAYFPRLQKNIC